MTVTTSMSVGRADGSVQPPMQIYAADATGTPKRVGSIYVGQANGTPKQVFNDTGSTPPPATSPPSASISPGSQSVNAAVNQTVTFNATITGSGGAGGPYTYNWQFRNSNGTQVASGNSSGISVGVSASQPGTYQFSIVGNAVDNTNNVSSQVSATATLTVS